MKEKFPKKLERETKAQIDKFFSVGKRSKCSCEDKLDAFHSFAIKIIFCAREADQMWN